MPRLTFSATNVAMAVACLWLGAFFGPSPKPVLITQVDTLFYSAFRDSLEAERLEADGLRAKLAGRVRVEPVHIFRTDTLVTPPDTVLRLVSVQHGELVLAPLIRTDSLWAPELHRFDVGNCDDGWSWAAGELVCDRARLGHLALYATMGVTSRPFGPMLNPALSTTAGLVWIPAFRSPWRAFTELDATGRLALGVTRSWTLF